MSAESAVDLARRLTRMIAATGPLSITQYMAEANAHYYGTRDPLGVAGDFTTAPEISQMFGELIGLCLADIWMRGAPGRPAAYVELGPGRGTLAQDALRSLEQVGFRPAVHLVETSPVLRGRQTALLPQAQHHDDIDSLPLDCPLLVVANEFFDALPIVQAEKTAAGWRERVVISNLTSQGRGFIATSGDRVLDNQIPPNLRADSAIGDIVESSPAAATIALGLANKIARQGGCALIIDYGYIGPAIGDTLQAVSRHGYANPFDNVGEVDLTAHVDFSILIGVAKQAGLRLQGPIGQGDFLTRLGIDARTQNLIRQAPERATGLMLARERLVAPNHMGTLFRVLAMSHPDWPELEGFS